MKLELKLLLKNLKVRSAIAIASQMAVNLLEKYRSGFKRGEDNNPSPIPLKALVRYTNTKQLNDFQIQELFSIPTLKFGIIIL